MKLSRNLKVFANVPKYLRTETLLSSRVAPKVGQKVGSGLVSGVDCSYVDAVRGFRGKESPNNAHEAGFNFVLSNVVVEKDLHCSVINDDLNWLMFCVVGRMVDTVTPGEVSELLKEEGSWKKVCGHVREEEGSCNHSSMVHEEDISRSIVLGSDLERGLGDGSGWASEPEVESVGEEEGKDVEVEREGVNVGCEINTHVHGVVEEMCKDDCLVNGVSLEKVEELPSLNQSSGEVHEAMHESVMEGVGLQGVSLGGLNGFNEVVGVGFNNNCVAPPYVDLDGVPNLISAPVDHVHFVATSSALNPNYLEQSEVGPTEFVSSQQDVYLVNKDISVDCNLEEHAVLFYFD
ncbi:unnamed protein product [Lupinus luteus]|uniref:Uncharacterized protein n=1 Tax=Lupinus luteus TaxID=3873 RepID=A0AAV1Y3F6_LUPLU